MNIEPLTLELEFKVSQFELFIKQHPERSTKLAITNYRNLLALIQEYKKLYQKYELLQSEYSEFIDILELISVSFVSESSHHE
ncbi:MAG: hypothetical protein ACFCAD_11000 [Pleurocapsa sp.]